MPLNCQGNSGVCQTNSLMGALNSITILTMKTKFLFSHVAKILIPTLFSFGLLNCTTKKVAEVAPPVNPYAALEKKIDGIQQDSEMPGLRVQVLERGQIKFDYTKGLRALGSTAEIQSKDKFPIGTATETLTAVMIGQLIDLKNLSWDTTIKDIVPHGMPIHASHRNTTVEMLLAQKAGLIDAQNVQSKLLWPQLAKMKTKEARQRLVRAILLAPPQFTPGTKVAHSDSAFVVLGWILEQKTNYPWEELVKIKILSDFFMDDCGFGSPASALTPAAPEPNQPFGHALNKEGKLEAVAPGSAKELPLAYGPAGTLHCSIQDWGKFLHMMAQGFYQDSAALSKETFDKLMANSNDSAYTSSGFLRYERAWSSGEALAQSGRHPSNYVITAIAPSKELVIMVMTNSGSKKAEQGAGKIIQLLTEIK